MTPHPKLIIFTDGAARGNPGPGGYGAVIWNQKLNEVVEVGGGRPNTTNNRMELEAVIAALAMVTHNQMDTHIYTDSHYVAQGAQSWRHGWAKRNWMTKNNTPVEHQKTWQHLGELLDERLGRTTITWHEVPGHSGIPGNERADRIATEFADAKDPTLFRGTLETYPHQSVTKIPSEAQIAGLAKARSEKRARSNAKAFGYVSLIDGEFLFHNTWAECEARVKGQKARFKKVFSEEEAEALRKEWLQ